jgi:hypothetical protein
VERRDFDPDASEVPTHTPQDERWLTFGGHGYFCLLTRT